MNRMHLFYDYHQMFRKNRVKLEKILRKKGASAFVEACLETLDALLNKEGEEFLELAQDDFQLSREAVIYTYFIGQLLNSITSNRKETDHVTRD